MTEREIAVSELRQAIVRGTQRQDMFWLGEFLLATLDSAPASVCPYCECGICEQKRKIAANGERAPQAFIDAKAERDAGWPELCADGELTAEKPK